jgi:hypothetical protein
MSKAPENIAGLFGFYMEVVKPLYGAVQLTNELPVEVLFEINAALDHISRKWAYNEPEADVVSKAYAHLKRSCFDIFKLHVKQAIDQFHELRRIDTSIIDNGGFDQRMLDLFARIKSGAQQARMSEGNTSDDDNLAGKAFDLWFPVYLDCVTFEKDFYRHPSLDWARKVQGRGKWVERGIGFGLGVLASIIAWLILIPFSK